MAVAFVTLLYMVEVLLMELYTLPQAVVATALVMNLDMVEVLLMDFYMLP